LGVLPSPQTHPSAVSLPIRRVSRRGEPGVRPELWANTKVRPYGFHVKGLKKAEGYGSAALSPLPKIILFSLSFLAASCNQKFPARR